MGRNIRTYNPWGHVSRADRVARQEAVTQMTAWLKLKDVPEFQELRQVVIKINHKQGADGDARRMNELANTLNDMGYTDRDIERALC